MKKILLSLFLLISLSFYSQVSNIVHCAGDTAFDLTSKYSLLIGNLNPAETTVSYHLTSDDAANGANPIASPTNFISTAASKTIYARIDHLGTITTNYFSLILNSALNVSATNKPIMCKGDTSSLTINASGGSGSYQYSVNGSAFTNTNYYTYLPAGVYNIQVRDAVNCITTTNYTITEPTAVSITNTVVNQNTIVNTATGGTAPYRYSLNGTNQQTSNTFTNLTPGTYSVYVLDSQGCGAAIATTILPFLTSTAAITKQIDCQSDASITVTANGGLSPYSYSINGGGYQPSNVFSNLTAGTYTIAVKDANGSINQSLAVTIPSLIPLTTTITKTEISCYGDKNGSITINTTGGKAPYTYSLENAIQIPITINQSSNVFNNLSAGSYGVKITDASGCLLLQTGINILEPTPILANASITPITCNNGTGTLTVSATGGTPPYKYSFDNGISYTAMNTLSTLVPGTYSIIVRDNNYCTLPPIVANITQATSPVITATLISNVQCKGDNSGSVKTDVITGLAPYTYSLDNGPYINGSASMIFTNLNAGTHNITMKDANGCFTTTQVTVSEPVSALMTEATIKNQTITINVSGGSGTYKYAISPDLDKFIMNNVFSELNPDSYVIQISDENGCSSTINVTVDPSPPTIDGQTNLTLPYKPGQTLANIIINGKNIKWYSSQHPLTGKARKTAETPLPLTTVLVEGTTYYASQTINGIESTERLAVTIKSDALGTNVFVIKDFTYYPNPVKNIFTISNTSVIDEVTLISIKGETLLTKRINSLHSEIDLSNFAKGVYFLKIKSEGTEKTVKLIKE